MNFIIDRYTSRNVLRLLSLIIYSSECDKFNVFASLSISFVLLPFFRLYEQRQLRFYFYMYKKHTNNKLKAKRFICFSSFCVAWCLLLVLLIDYTFFFVYSTNICVAMFVRSILMQCVLCFFFLLNCKNALICVDI